MGAPKSVSVYDCCGKKLAKWHSTKTENESTVLPNMPVLVGVEIICMN